MIYIYIYIYNIILFYIYIISKSDGKAHIIPHGALKLDNNTSSKSLPVTNSANWELYVQYADLYCSFFSVN